MTDNKELLSKESETPVLELLREDSLGVKCFKKLQVMHERTTINLLLESMAKAYLRSAYHSLVLTGKKVRSSGYASQ